ncbi:---NA---, partial [Paramuricea clavata]
GDEFTILAHAGDGWYLAKDKYGWIGYIPGNFMLQKNVLGTDVSVKDESEIPSILQYENPKSETVKASERECDGTIKRQTVALNERTNDFKELQQERE